MLYGVWTLYKRRATGCRPPFRKKDTHSKKAQPYGCAFLCMPNVIKRFVI